MEDLSFEMNVAAAKLARASADAVTAKTPDRPRIVAGAMGPTNRTASISPDVNNPGFRNVSYDELVEAYSEQARGLIEGGADVLLIETIFDTLNAKAAGFAALTVFDEMGIELPLIISGTITDRSGRTLSGQTPEAFYFSMRHLQALRARPQLRAGRRADAPLHRRDRRRRRHARHRLSQRRPAQRHGRVRRGPLRDGRPHRAVDARGPRQHRRRLLRLHARAHRRDRRARRQGASAQGAQDRAARCASPASNRSCTGDAMVMESGQIEHNAHRALSLSPRGEDARP